MLLTLDNSLDPLVDAFNSGSTKRRFLTLLSPT
jgi:hypothetical protein